MATIIPDTTNTLFQIATDLINQSTRNIFLTGKAGTGKTTFLKYIRETCPKQMAVVAPTGVAAINAGGVTIHSFLQLPFSPFIPVTNTGNNTEIVDKHSLLSRLKFTNEKRKLLQQLELLIIDEVSMVRADVLDAVDTVLRHARRNPSEKFGGVQVLFIGDMFQLPPVVKEQEWNILSSFYESPYFFDSLVIKEEPPLYIEFEKVYRQNDRVFIDLLNQVRHNELNEVGKAILESRFNPGLNLTEDEEQVLLTTHNEIARNINRRGLDKLPSRQFTYLATVEGDFPESAFPAENELQLKEGARVMFIRNDSSEKGKRYFNGKIGTVTRLEKEKIIVRCKDDEEDIEVTQEEWDNIRYTLNKTSQSMEENVLGSFKQFPLRLAWAITIHKSQGLTFDKVIIDAGEAFAPGQVYVALSRCTNLEGMVLKSRLRKNSLLSDPRIIAFSKRSSSSVSLKEELALAKKQYQEKILLETFNFSSAIDRLRELKRHSAANKTSFNEDLIPWLQELDKKLTELQNTAFKFHAWIRNEFLNPINPEENKTLAERSIKAAEHFIAGVDIIIQVLYTSPAYTDSREIAREYNELIKQLFTELAETKFALQGIDGRFNILQWLARKKEFVLPSFFVNAYAGSNNKKTDSPHPELQSQLRKKREEICSRRDLPIYLVAGTTTIDEMTRYLPQTLEELRMISGFGDAKIKSYGDEFLNVILEYATERQLSSLIHEKLATKPKKKTSFSSKEKKPSTFEVSLKFYKEGLTIKQIAEQRKLTTGTVESHFAQLIEDDRVRLETLIPGEKINKIKKAMNESNGASVTAIKEKLGKDYSWGEIRMVIAANKTRSLPD